MTDHRKVLVFGSFTEDELKSFQQQRPENETEIKFGSLDSTTLKSVGFSNFTPTKLVESRGRFSNQVNKEKQVSGLCETENASDKVATTVKKIGSIHDSCSVPHVDDVRETRTNSVVSGSCASKNVFDSLNQSSLNQHGIEDVAALSRLKEKEAVLDYSNAVDPVGFTENIHQASDRLKETVKSLLPRGLVNLGNLCFLNAILQALLSCAPFVLLLQELRTRNVNEIGYPALRAFVEFISQFDVPFVSRSKIKGPGILETGRPFHPIMFESVLKIFSPDVPNISGRPRQEDAQEFLSFIMHQMHDELIKLDGGIPSGNGLNTSLVSSMNNEDDDDDEKWETVGPRNKTAITRTQSFIPSKLSSIFGGQLRSVVKARGSKASATIQPFLLLHLNILPEPVRTIEDALRLFSAPETLEGYKTLTTEKKAEVVRASKSVKILKLSEIMILHLMRFSYDESEGGSTKLLKPVLFPLELVLGRELLASPSSEGRRRYELVGTVTHHGSEACRGHYTADARHGPSGKWIRYDDASVTVIPRNKVLHDQAYILFYKQQL